MRRGGSKCLKCRRYLCCCVDLLGSERVGDSRPGLGVGRGVARACGSGIQTNQRNNRKKKERERESIKREEFSALLL